MPEPRQPSPVQRAVRADPNSGVAACAQGLTRRLLGDDDGAEKDCHRTTELDSHDQVSEVEG